MKRTYLTLIILMLVIGFAAVSTNLIINGTINFGFNQNDFFSNIVFVYTDTINGQSQIIEDGKSVVFNTTILENVGQKAIMDFEIANKSIQYDANVTIECSLEDESKSYSDYIDIKQNFKNPFELQSGETKSGRITIILKKAYNNSLKHNIDMLCTIKATPVERDTEGTYTPKEHQYKETLLNGADPVLENSISIAGNEQIEKLIPVTIEEDGTVKRADTTKEWYNYEKKKWANAIILTDNSQSSTINPGDVISEDKIESYFVWIPKYSYKIQTLESSSQGQEKAFEIQFGLNDTIDDETKMECKTPMNEDKTQGLSGNNGKCRVGDWMTHPAFIAFNVNGFWVGKFEVGEKGAASSRTNVINNYDATDLSKILIKPNQYTWVSTNVSTMHQLSFNYQRELDSHMMKNTEWGAVSYLTQSIYGKCVNSSSCLEVFMNNNGNFITGYASTIGNPSDNVLFQENVKIGSDGEKTVNYFNKKSVYASTTGNYTGIYDMSGGSNERVMGLMLSNQGEFVSGNNSNENSGFKGLYSDGSGQNTIGVDFPKKQYYDQYKYGTDFSIRILGDATAETNNWYKDTTGYLSYSRPWYTRGGYSGDIFYVGLYYFNNSNGNGKAGIGFRIVLAPL